MAQAGRQACKTGNRQAVPLFCIAEASDTRFMLSLDKLTWFTRKKGSKDSSKNAFCRFARLFGGTLERETDM